MTGDNSTPEKNKASATVDQFTDELIKALDSQAGITQAPRRERRNGVQSPTEPALKKEIDPFFTSRVWFFLAVFAVIVNMVMMGIAFRQHMRIDYLISKIIGE